MSGVRTMIQLLIRCCTRHFSVPRPKCSLGSWITLCGCSSLDWCFSFRWSTSHSRDLGFGAAQESEKGKLCSLSWGGTCAKCGRGSNGGSRTSSPFDDFLERRFSQSRRKA